MSAKLAEESQARGKAKMNHMVLAALEAGDQEKLTVFNRERQIQKRRCVCEHWVAVHTSTFPVCSRRRPRRHSTPAATSTLAPTKNVLKRGRGLLKGSI